MASAEPVEPLVDDIYGAAIDAGRWPAVLGAIAAHFGSASAHLSFENVQSTQGRMISFGIDPRYAASYADYYVTRNVLWRTLVERHMTGVTCDRLVMPRDELCRTEFYNDFLQPQDGEEVLASQFFRDSERGITLTLWRPSRLGTWQRADLDRLAALTPHLIRAVRIGEHVEAAEAINGVSDEALYRLGRGLMIVSGTAEVLFANRLAEGLFTATGGLRRRHGRLYAGTSDQTETLHALIATAVERGTGGSVIVTREPAPPLLLIVAPIRAETWRAVGGRPGAMVLTKEIGRPAERPLDAFGRHYRLTPAELRVTRELLAGDGIAAAAARLRISDATARTHRARLFQKTGARRQAELVRILLDFSDGAIVSGDGVADRPAG